MRKVALVIFLALVVASIISDVSRPETTNSAPLLEGVQIPAEVRSTLERACRDCHSDATRYPWYSHIAPVSWLVHSDVRSGRKHLNFSKWSEYSVIQRERRLSEIANQVQDGGMPIGIYTLIHRDAKLSSADVKGIFEWTQAERARLIAENSR